MSPLSDFFARRVVPWALAAIDPEATFEPLGTFDQSPRAAVASARVAYAALAAMYDRLDKDAVANVADAAEAPRLNAIVSKRAVAEMDGAGVVRRKTAEANAALARWRERNQHRRGAADAHMDAADVHMDAADANERCGGFDFDDLDADARITGGGGLGARLATGDLDGDGDDDLVLAVER